MTTHKINPQILFSTLWIFVLFNIIFRDLHEFLAEATIEEMMNQKVSHAALLFYAVILEIPILMVLLSQIVNNTINKWANMIAASFMILGTFSLLLSSDLDDLFFGTIEIAALILLLYTAWKLPYTETTEI